MKKRNSFMRSQSVLILSIVTAFFLLILSLFFFMVQVNHYIDKDMHSQVTAIRKNSVVLVQNELKYLQQITSSGADLIKLAKIQTNNDIIQVLQNYARNSDIVRALFVTLDGRAYTSYAGYLGQNDKDTSIEGIPLKDIDKTFFSQPYYAEDLDEIIFGVISPVVMAGQKGVLVSSYNVSKLYGLMENAFLDGTVEMSVLNSRGKVLTGRTSEDFQLDVFEKYSQVDFLDSSVQKMKADFDQGKSGFASYQVDNVVRHCSYAPLEINDWYLFVVVKKSALSSNLSQLQDYGIQLAALLIVIMTLLFVVILLIQYKNQQKTQMVLERAAMIDGLTGVLNRSATEKSIGRFLKNVKGDVNIALLVLDIDDFKQVNDTKGHTLGDDVLRKCAQLLKENFDEKDIVGRIGGDEFVVLAKDYGDVETLKGNIQNFLNHFYVQTSSEALKVSASIGVVLTENGTHSFLELYKAADTALYQTKQSGKGAFVLRKMP